MALLTVQNITTDGVTPSYAAGASGGDTFANDGRTFFHVKNANVSVTRTVTVDSLSNCNQGVDHNAVVVVATSSEEMIGPFPSSRWNSPTGIVTVTYDDETDLTVAAIHLGA